MIHQIRRIALYRCIAVSQCIAMYRNVTRECIRYRKMYRELRPYADAWLLYAVSVWRSPGSSRQNSTWEVLQISQQVNKGI